jgi:hypothetical protein
VSGRRRSPHRWFLDKLGQGLGRYLFDGPADPSRTIWVVGDGRSGTTWLSNVINYDRRLRFLFEPFHRLVLGTEGSYRDGKYLAPGQVDGEFERLTRRILSGRCLAKRVNEWNQGTCFDGRLVKDIFANLFVGWATDLFSDVRVVFLLRHPFSVAWSKLRLSHWHWLTEPAALLADDDLRRDFLQDHVDAIQRAETQFEKLVVLWCIQHIVPLTHLDASRVHVVFYEDLVRHRREEIERLFSYLGVAWPAEESVLMAQVEASSFTSKRGGSHITAAARLAPWTDGLSPGQVKRATSFLEDFELSGIYDADPSPHRQGLNDYMVSHTWPRKR